MQERALLALTVGDPAGIGPELVRAVLARRSGLEGRPRLVVLGPECERPADLPLLDSEDALARDALAGDASWIATAADGAWEPGRPQAAAGRAALAALRAGAELAAARRVDALVTAPVSKEALHRAGEPVEGQSELLGRWAGCEVQMLAVADRLRVLLLTRHLPLVEALAAVGTELVVERLHQLHAGLVGLGCEAPRLALAGLNPHAGEGGLLGREELDLLVPAVERARTGGLDVSGPEPPDSVFVRGARGDFDGVLALYHDQAFIPIKLTAPRRGLTVLLGLPYLRVSPAHGTAFDLAGSGRADPAGLVHALEEAARLSRHSAARSRA